MSDLILQILTDESIRDPQQILAWLPGEGTTMIPWSS